METSGEVTPLVPFAHLGVGVFSRQEVDRLCQLAKARGCLVREAEDSGAPVGYWAFLRDPDGHTLEVAYGQELGLAVEGGAYPIRPYRMHRHYLLCHILTDSSNLLHDFPSQLIDGHSSILALRCCIE